MTKANLHSTTSATALTATDEPLIGLYHQWQAAHAATEAAEGDVATDAASNAEEALAEQITTTPPRTVVGVLIKAQLAEFLIRSSRPAGTIGDTPERLAINAMRDARRFLARADADAIEVVPELPSNSLAAAEAEIARRYVLFEEREDQSDEAGDAILNPATELDRFIAATPPASMADVAVKLRRVLDATVGMASGANIYDIPSLAQILAYVHTITGEPTHPTRPTSTGDEDEEEADTEATEAAAQACEARLVAGFREMIAGNAAIPTVRDADRAAMIALIPDADSEIKALATAEALADDAWGITAANDPKWDELSQQSKAASRKINETPARTLGGARYKAAKLLAVLTCDGFDLPPQWQLDTLCSVIADLDRFATPEPAADPLAAMCAEWHRIHAELSASYNTAEIDTSCAIHDRLEALTDRITATIPAAVPGFAMQLAIVRQWHVEHNGLLPSHEDARFIEDDVWFENREAAFVHRVLGHAGRFASSPIVASFTDPVLSLCRQFGEADRECQEIEQQGRAPGLKAFTPECLAQEAALAAAMDRRAAIARQMIATPATTPAGAFAVMACVEPLALARHGSPERLFAEIDTALMMTAIASAKRIAQLELTA